MKLLPEFYICICGAAHGNPTESEKIEATFANEELGDSWETNRQYRLNILYNQPALVKVCDKCQAQFDAIFEPLRHLELDEQTAQQLSRRKIRGKVLVESEDIVPYWYTCYCGRRHGTPPEAGSTFVVSPGEQDGESSTIVKDEEVGAGGADGVIKKTIEHGRLIFWKLCDKKRSSSWKLWATSTVRDCGSFVRSPWGIIRRS